MDIRATGAANAAANVDKVTAAQKRLGNEIDKTAAKSKTASKSVGALDQSLKTMGAFRWLSYAGFATVATGIGAITHEALSFEDAMAKVQAVNKEEFAATPGLFNKTWRETLDIAQEFRSTGAEAADALYQIEAAGVSAGEGMGVLRSSLNLAQAAGYGQADSAQLMLGIMNSWGLKTEDTAMIADILTQAVNVSAINMEDLGYTMKYLSGPAAIANQSLEDVLETVALLGRAGMRGQNVGTGLATGLARLADATPETEKMMKGLGKGMWYFQDTAGNLLKLPRIIEKVAELIGGMSRVDQAEVLGNLFGKDAADVWGTLLNLQLNNKDLVEQNKQEMADYQGQAEETAKVMNSTVSASFERLWGSITAITSSEFMQSSGPLQRWLDSMSESIDAFDMETFLRENKDTFDALGQVAEDTAYIFTELVVPAFEDIWDQLTPLLLPSLFVLKEVLGFIKDNAETLQPVLESLLAIFIVWKGAVKAAALWNFIFGTSLLAAGGGGAAGKGAAAGAGGLLARFLGAGAAARFVRGASIPVIGFEASRALSPWVSQNVTDPIGRWTDPLEDFLGENRDIDPRLRGRYGARGVGNPDYVPAPPPPVASDRERISPESFGRFGSTADSGVRLPVVIQIDGREVATAVARHTGDAGARR
jgi:TP901 family phage tail tape measure protein